MYYHIRAKVNGDSESEVKRFRDAIIREAEKGKYKHLLKKLEVKEFYPSATIQYMYFEAWLDKTLTDQRLNIFDQLKGIINKYTGWVDWHECTHDEADNQPCIIEEKYEV